MIDIARPAPPPPIGTAASRHAAFHAAGRHSSRVRVLRRVIGATVLFGITGVLGFAFFNPFRMAIPSASVESAGLNGSKVTMDKPKLSGFKSDGRPYTLNARSAVQDARTPSMLELLDLDAHVTMSDKSVAHVVSASGVYDSSKETMTFGHDVHLSTDSGFDVRMQSAYVEFKTGVVDTQQPLTVVMSSGTVSADAMHMTDNGKAVTFSGRVHSVMLPPGEGVKTASTLKGPVP